MAYQFVLIERDGPVGIVTLNRPQQRNALSHAVMRELVDAVETFDRDDEVRAIVLTGGQNVFSAGADLKEMASTTVGELLQSDRIALWDRLRNVSKPLIAAVSGFALGGGCELALLCDIIVASETACFGQPEINVGLMPGAGGTQRLTRVVGKFRAMEMVLLGKTMSAHEAERCGLVNRVVPAELLLDEAKAIGRQLAGKAPISLRLAKEAVLRAFEAGLEGGLPFERKLFTLLFATEDAQEGMRAFLEKRKPKYQGK